MVATEIRIELLENILKDTSNMYPEYIRGYLMEQLDIEKNGI